MSRLRRFAVLQGTALFFVSLVARAQDSKIDKVLKQLEAVRSFSDVSISPDGKFVAWVSKAGEGTSVYLLDWKKAGAKAKRIAAGDPLDKPEASGIAWSPDSSQIAFLSHGSSSSQDQIYRLYVAGGSEAKQISKLGGHVSTLRWAPNGKSLAFLYAERGGGGGPLEAVPAQL
ncbi:MAG: hypothetical protein M3Y72_00160, partial [Acidobacteriota bacterium]|nr:hypothetical protein [Acidobacteriota bacterium]